MTVEIKTKAQRKTMDQSELSRTVAEYCRLHGWLLFCFALFVCLFVLLSLFILFCLSVCFLFNFLAKSVTVEAILTDTLVCGQLPLRPP